MVSAMERYIPDIPILCEADIMDRWGKNAESKRLDDGTLSIYWYDVEQLRDAAFKWSDEDPIVADRYRTEADALEKALVKRYFH